MKFRSNKFRSNRDAELHLHSMAAWSIVVHEKGALLETKTGI